MSVPNFATSPNSAVKSFWGFLRSEKSILRFIFSGCASFSWFFIFFCCDRATRQEYHKHHQQSEFLLEFMDVHSAVCVAEHVGETLDGVAVMV